MVEIVTERKNELKDVLREKMIILKSCYLLGRRGSKRIMKTQKKRGKRERDDEYYFFFDCSVKYKKKFT